MSLKFKCALISGGSSGIGAATAREMARAGLDIILLARREDRLKALAAELIREHKVNVSYYVADIRNASAIASLKIDFSRVDVLVNSAGLAKGTDKMQSANLEDWDTMIDTNVKGLLYLTRLVLPHMIALGQGHIMNIGSVAGRWVYPGGGVYCASKFAVRAISEGLRLDLLGTPIRITNIEPGMVETEFSEVRFADKEKAKQVYKGMKPLSDADIAESVMWCLQRPAHVNIQELVIFPTDQPAVGIVNRAQPTIKTL